MNIVLIILSILLIVMGLLLCVASPVPGVLAILLGIGLIVYSRKAKKKSVKDIPPAPLIPSETQKTAAQTVSKPSGIPSRKAEKTATVKLTGVTYNCELSDKQRQDVLSEMSAGEEVEIQEYDFAGKSGYLVVDPDTGNDIGTLPAEIATAYPDRDIEGYLTLVESFTPEDGRNDIYYARIKIYILED